MLYFFRTRAAICAASHHILFQTQPTSSKLRQHKPASLKSFSTNQSSSRCSVEKPAETKSTSPCQISQRIQGVTDPATIHTTPRRTAELKDSTTHHIPRKVETKNSSPAYEISQRNADVKDSTKASQVPNSTILHQIRNPEAKHLTSLHQILHRAPEARSSAIPHPHPQKPSDAKNSTPPHQSSQTNCVKDSTFLHQTAHRTLEPKTSLHFTPQRTPEVKNSVLHPTLQSHSASKNSTTLHFNPERTPEIKSSFQHRPSQKSPEFKNATTLNFTPQRTPEAKNSSLNQIPKRISEVGTVDHSPKSPEPRNEKGKNNSPREYIIPVTLEECDPLTITEMDTESIGSSRFDLEYDVESPDDASDVQEDRCKDDAVDGLNQSDRFSPCRWVIYKHLRLLKKLRHEILAQKTFDFRANWIPL